MSNSITQCKIIGWVLVILVGLGVFAPQVLGKPYVYGHIWDFNWKFGFPCAFLLCNGRKTPSLPPAPKLRDATDSHWTTRLLVPITHRSKQYDARTSVLLTSESRVLKFNVYCLLLDILYAFVLVAGAIYFTYRMANTPSLYVYTTRLMVILTFLCLAYYVYVVLTWDGRLYVTLYYPPILAFNGLGIFCVIMSLSLIFRQNDTNKKPQHGR